MTASLRLPRMLTHSVRGGLVHQVSGGSVRDALDDLIRMEPGLGGHLLDEAGEIRPHVSLFVDGLQAGLDTPLRDGANIRILHAVSGGAS